MYAYKNEDCTIKADANELYNACKKGCIFALGIYEALPCSYGKAVDLEIGKELFTEVTVVIVGKVLSVYSREFTI